MSGSGRLKTVFSAALFGCLLGGSWGSVSTAQELLFHFPLDGSPANLGSAGDGEAKVYVKDGEAPPTTVPGKIGSAFQFNGMTPIAVPFSLDSAAYPAVTMTAWVRFPIGERGGKTVFSAGNGNVPRLQVTSGRVGVTGGRGFVSFDKDMPYGEWTFVAGVIDLANQRITAYQGEEKLVRDGINIGNLYPPTSYANPDDSSLPRVPYVFVGNHHFSQWPATGMAIDDVRVYAGALTDEQIADIRTSAGADLAEPESIGETEKNLTPDGSTLTAPNLAAPAPGRTLRPDLGTATTAEDMVGTGGATGGDDVDESLVGTGGATGGDQTSSTTSPFYQDRTLTGETADAIAAKRDGIRPEDITYASEEEAQAAAAQREREAAEEELARQQNELEAARRTEEEAATEGPEKTGMPYPVGGPKFSSVAGISGANIQMLDIESEFIDDLILRRDDIERLCWIGAYGQGDEYRLLDLCSADFGYGRTAAARLEDAAIGSIAVCTFGPDQRDSFKRKNESIQGIRVTGSRIKEDGTIIYVPAAQEGRFPTGCKQWSPRMLCPVNPDHLATGVVVHSRDSGDGHQEIVGLQLICREVGIK